jgi:hypothetical protein
LALAAVGILVWSGKDVPGLGFLSPPTPEQRLVSDMDNVVSAGGFAASFADNDAGRWRVAEGHRFERLSVDSARAVIGRLSSEVPLNVKPPSWESQGLSIELPASFAQQANGRRLEIGIIARAAQSNTSGVLSAVFATRQAGNSGWRNFKLGPNFQTHQILFDMPALDTGYTAKPIVVVHADAAGKGRSVELIGVFVRLVPRTPTQS